MGWQGMRLREALGIGWLGFGMGKYDVNSIELNLSWMCFLEVIKGGYFRV